MEGMLSSPAFGAGSAPDSVCWWIQPPPAAGLGWCLAFTLLLQPRQRLHPQRAGAGAGVGHGQR